MKLDMQEQPLSSPVHPAFLSSYPDASNPQGVSTSQNTGLDLSWSILCSLANGLTIPLIWEERGRVGSLIFPSFLVKEGTYLEKLQFG